MCSISGSFSKEKIVELCELNKYRGEHSHSISYYNPVEKIFLWVDRNLGPIDYSRINIPEGYYCIVHQQAPTTENTTKEFIHPAQIGGSLLWHNGILKPGIIDVLQKLTGFVNNSWDSYLLLCYIYNYGLRAFNPIEGSFSCLYYDVREPELYLFRNRIAPMFYDDNMNISSTKFDDCTSLPAESVFTFKPDKYEILSTGIVFETLNNPYLV